jgi:uncharacterized protein YecT (DUF1311 family)
MGDMRISQRVLLTCMAIWVSVAVSLAAAQPTNEPCAGMTTAEMRECLNQRYKQADTALNQLYQQLMSQLSKTRRIKLREAQQAWVLFRDKSAAFGASAAEGGTMQPLLSLSVLTSMTEKRVAELKDLLHFPFQ